MDEWAISTEETAITIAASIMQHFVEQGRNVGLVARGMHSEIVNTDRGERQTLKMLEALSVVHADGGTELQEVLTAEAVRFGRNSALVVVTPSADEGWVAGLLPLVYRGVKAVAVIVDAESFGAPRGTYRVVTSLTAANVPVYMVRRGEEIGRALSHPIGLVGRRAADDPPDAGTGGRPRAARGSARRRARPATGRPVIVVAPYGAAARGAGVRIMARARN